jgi:hypothetical protein
MSGVSNGVSALGNTDTKAKKQNQNSSKRYVFTLHNYSKDEIVSMVSHFDYNNWKYIFGEEKGKSGLTPHLQGYLELPSKKRIVTIKNELKIDRLHMETAKGNRDSNIVYCSKENNSIYTNFEQQEEPDYDWDKESYNSLELKYHRYANHISIYDGEMNVVINYCKYLIAERQYIDIDFGTVNEVMKQMFIAPGKRYVMILTEKRDLSNYIKCLNGIIKHNGKSKIYNISNFMILNYRGIQPEY